MKRLRSWWEEKSLANGYPLYIRRARRPVLWFLPLAFANCVLLYLLIFGKYEWGWSSGLWDSLGMLFVSALILSWAVLYLVVYLPDKRAREAYHRTGGTLCPGCLHDLREAEIPGRCPGCEREWTLNLIEVEWDGYRAGKRGRIGLRT